MKILVSIWYIFSHWNRFDWVCGLDGKSYQNSCYSACTIKRRDKKHIKCKGRCPCRSNRSKYRSAGDLPKEGQQQLEQTNNNTAAVAGPAHNPEAETSSSPDKPTKPNDGKPDEIETAFRLADSNKDGVQDLAEFRGLEDVEDVVRKLFQHYDKVR